MCTEMRRSTTETIHDGTEPILTRASGLSLAMLVTTEPTALAVRTPKTSIHALALKLCGGRAWMDGMSCMYIDVFVDGL